MAKGSTVTIELDASVVRDAVNAHVRPAVDKILATIDLPTRIATALLAKPPKESGDRYFGYAMGFMGAGSGLPKIDDLINQSLHEAAQSFVKKAIAKERPKIEAAFRKMMANSSSSLAKTLLESLDGALKDEWRFELRSTVSPKERDRY